jgi:hypothetical protein
MLNKLTNAVVLALACISAVHGVTHMANSGRCRSCAFVSSHPKLPRKLTTASSVDGNPGRCEASLTFENNEFLPVRFTIDPVECQGNQEARIVIPAEAPDGNVALSWWGRTSSRCPQRVWADLMQAVYR